jgi:hypothetical protein
MTRSSDWASAKNEGASPAHPDRAPAMFTVDDGIAAGAVDVRENCRLNCTSPWTPAPMP